MTNVSTEEKFFAYPKRADIYVVDKNGNPVPDAHVVFTEKGVRELQTSSFIPRLTNKDGRITFINPDVGTFSIEISKDNNINALQHTYLLLLVLFRCARDLETTVSNHTKSKCPQPVPATNTSWGYIKT